MKVEIICNFDSDLSFCKKKVCFFKLNLMFYIYKSELIFIHHFKKIIIKKILL